MKCVAADKFKRCINKRDWFRVGALMGWDKLYINSRTTKASIVLFPSAKHWPISHKTSSTSSQIALDLSTQFTSIHNKLNNSYSHQTVVKSQKSVTISTQILFIIKINPFLITKIPTQSSEKKISPMLSINQKVFCLCKSINQFN